MERNVWHLTDPVPIVAVDAHDVVVLRSFSHFRWLCSVMGCHRSLIFVCLELTGRAWNNTVVYITVALALKCSSRPSIKHILCN
jgi:hypothetical protein